MLSMSGQSGFTLIELMIAMAVSVFAVLGFLATTTAIQQSSESSFARNVAIQDANQVLEQIREDAQSGEFPSNVTGNYQSGQSVSGFSNLDSEAITVNYVDSSADPLDVTVTVSWQDKGTRTATQTLRTFVTQRTGAS